MGRIDAGTACATLQGNTAGFTSAFVKAQLATDAVRQGIRLLGAGLKSAVKFMADATKAAAVQEQSMVNLTAALSRAGERDAPKAAAEFAKFASALQDVSTVGDEVTLQAASLAASFGITGKELEQTTQAAVDLSAATGTDLKASMLLLGKAFKGETGSLSRYGIILDKSTPKSEKFAESLKIINQQFGGAAEAQAKTYAGRIEQLGNRWGDLLEAVGQNIQENEIINSVIQVVTQSVADLTSFIEGNQDTIKGWVDQGWLIAIKVMDAFIQVGGFIAKMFQALKIVGTGALLAMAKGWQLQLKVTELVLTPLSKILDAMVAIGALKTNPLADGFKSAQAAADLAVESFGEVLDEQLQGFDAIDKGVAGLRGKLAGFNRAVQENAKTIKTAYEGTALPAIQKVDEEARKAAEKAAAAAAKLMAEAQQQAADVAQTIGDSLGQAFAGLVTGVVSAGEALRSFASTAVSTFSQILTQKLIADQVAAASTRSRAVGEVTANAASAASGAAASQAAIPLIGPALAIAALASVSAIVLGLLSSFHTGTISASSNNLLRLPGMRPDEGMAKIQSGEQILSRQDMAGRGRGDQVRVTEIRMPLPLSRPQMRRFQKDVFFPEARRARLVPAMR